MRSLLSEFLHRLDHPRTVIVVDEATARPPQQHLVRPRVLWMSVGAVALGSVLVTALLFLFTPLREIIPGYGTDEIQRDARLNALRVAALQDSLEVQQQYVGRLQRLVMGELDSTFGASAAAPEPGFSVSGELASVAGEPMPDDWQDHRQPAVPIASVPAGPRSTSAAPAEMVRNLPSLRLPVVPPVSGLFTRGFDARVGHFALDIVVPEGTVVRAIGDGYVVMADWTHEGGYVIAVQHADGYVSMYKHNQRLLKRVGERVREREAIAVSGNTGEITTGPHLHFELWRDGLAQDPQAYFINP